MPPVTAVTIFIELLTALIQQAAAVSKAYTDAQAAGREPDLNDLAPIINSNDLARANVVVALANAKAREAAQAAAKTPAAVKP